MTNKQKFPPCPDGIDPDFFALMCDDSGSNLSGNYNFEKLENIPAYCQFFIPEKPLEFLRPDGMKNYPVLELPLLAALQTMDEEARYRLKPGRWNLIKKELSAGKCMYPWITATPGGQPLLKDGRHRIVYMLRILKMEKAPFVVDPEYLDTVKKWAASTAGK